LLPALTMATVVMERPEETGDWAALPDSITS